MIEKTFWQVDAFTREPYQGNPAAVVFDAEGVSSEKMQAIAREMNLSETIFVLRPTDEDADYWARIFTPAREIPFAGHPTLATAYAMLASERAAPREGALRQQCGIGIVPVAVQPDSGSPHVRFTMTQGRPERRPADVDRALAARMLGCPESDVGDSPVEVCSTGLPWLIVPVRALRAMKALEPDQRLILDVCRSAEAVGLTTFCLEAESEEAGIRLRSFVPGEGVAEDPVCGSGNGATAAYLAAHHFGEQSDFRYVAEQGVEIGRPGTVYVESSRDPGDERAIRVGGYAVRVMEGRLWV